MGNAKWNVANLDKHMKDEVVPTEMIQFTQSPSKTVIRYEPLGVIAVYEAWNYFFSLTMQPLIDAISSGNYCIVKPSELSPTTSTVIKRLFNQYMDPDCVQCC